MLCFALIASLVPIFVALSPQDPLNPKPETLNRGLCLRFQLRLTASVVTVAFDRFLAKCLQLCYNPKPQALNKPLQNPTP